MKSIIKTSDAPAPIGPYNQAVKTGNFLFISGQIAINPENGNMDQNNVKDEAARVMLNLQAILKEAGMGFDHVVKSTIFLKNLNNFAEVNEVYGSYFKAEFPARETVEVSRLPKDANVEISMIAFKG